MTTCPSFLRKWWALIATIRAWSGWATSANIVSTIPDNKTFQSGLFSFSVLMAIFQVNLVSHQRMMEVVWQLEPKSCKAPGKSSPPTNQHQHPTLYRLDPLLSPNQQLNSVKALKGKYHFYGLAYPKLTWDLLTLSVTPNSSWLPSGWLCHTFHQSSDASTPTLWCQSGLLHIYIMQCISTFP